MGLSCKRSQGNLTNAHSNRKAGVFYQPLRMTRSTCQGAVVRCLQRQTTRKRETHCSVRQPLRRASGGSGAIFVNAGRRMRPQLASDWKSSVLIIHSVADLIIVSARCAGGLFVLFRYEIGILPIGPLTIFGLHWTGGQLQAENSVGVI